MTQLEPIYCRRCSRLLRDHLSARAGLGPRCALFEAADAAQEPQGAVVAPAERPPAADASAALAAVTALVHGLPDDVVDGIVADAGADITKVLAGLLAWCIRETDGGPAWLERTALDWAREGVG